MTSYREKILEATKEAHKIKQEAIEGSKTKLDLWNIVDDLDIPVLFRPLDNLWGGAITIEGEQGILIKSSLPKHLQRFTLAHELGHIVLGHENRFDDELSVNMRVSTQSDRPIEEMTADTFASELLASKELISLNANRNDWSREQLQTPEYIYQLSLRLGISFEATTWALVDHELLSQEKAEDFKYNDLIVKKSKSHFAPDSISRNPHADVWSLSEKEEDILIDADKEDVFIIELEERSSSGYRWEFFDESSVRIGFNEQKEGEKYGSYGSRKIGFEFPDPGKHSIRLKHMRPWNDDVIEELNFLINTRGGEEIGLPRTKKQAVLQGEPA